jgi:3-dehydroquinate synthase
VSAIIYSNDLLELLPICEAYSAAYILCDSNTYQKCFPKLPGKIQLLDHLVIDSGEKNKSLSSCQIIWKFLSDKNADRHCLLINLGGGMITDLGGFAASAYKRGIDFVNIPTSLLGMVDAAIGGKTGVNFEDYKNQVGAFCKAKSIIINEKFLESLPQEELDAAFAEILKYGLIIDEAFYHSLNEKPKIPEMKRLIEKCIYIKEEITWKDPLEKAERKLLNFGHTFGHALESIALDQGNEILHGDAIASGIIIASYLSTVKSGLPYASFQNIVNKINKLCSPVSLANYNKEEIIKYLYQDKKNAYGNIRMVLLKDIGSAVYDVIVQPEEINLALDFIKNIL